MGMISDGYLLVNPLTKISYGYIMDTMSDEERRHSEPVLLRFQPEQLALIDRAAEHAGLARTGWIRMALLKQARLELAEPSADG